MAKLFTNLSDAQFESLADLAADGERLRRTRRAAASDHSFGECERPFRCPAHRREHEGRKAQRRAVAAAMASVYDAPITGTAAYADASRWVELTGRTR